MKIVRRNTEAGAQLAVVDASGDLVDLPGERDLIPLLDGRLRAVAEAALRDRAVVTPEADAELLAPLEPTTFRDFSTFPEHTAGIVKLADPTATVSPEFWEIPTFYFSNPYAITGPTADIPVPPNCVDFDFELEVAAVVGRTGRDLTVEAAADHIAGYVVLNDFSARDVQFHEMQLRLGPAKGKDTATSLGQYFVTADELEPRRSGSSFDLRMEVRVNGEVIGSDRLDNMAWTFPALAAYASRGTDIRPGDLLGSGTCQGGCLAELWGRHGRDFHAPLAPGDVVTTSVELLGGTTNRVVAGAQARPIEPFLKASEFTAQS
jgi:2-keto-4-pentenoate hydratase/2-oxohepta-3-ene-1,7-dioic acid hydratase in catechol pathway